MALVANSVKVTQLMPEKMPKLIFCHRIFLRVWQILLLNQNCIAQIPMEHLHDGIVMLLIAFLLVTTNQLHQFCSRGKHRFIAHNMYRREGDIRWRHKLLENLYCIRQPCLNLFLRCHDSPHPLIFSSNQTPLLRKIIIKKQLIKFLNFL